MWWSVPIIPATAGSIKLEDCGSGQPEQKSNKHKVTLTSKITSKKGWSMIQVLSACLASVKP
jgi:hypothetical protein